MNVDRVWVRCDEALYGDEWLLIDECASDDVGEFQSLAVEVAEGIWNLMPATHRGGPITIVLQEGKDGRELARVRVRKIDRTEYRGDLVAGMGNRADDAPRGVSS